MNNDSDSGHSGRNYNDNDEGVKGCMRYPPYSEKRAKSRMHRNCSVVVEVWCDSSPLVGCPLIRLNPFMEGLFAFTVVLWSSVGPQRNA